ncbi:hypothetical protein HOA59_00645, partial [archaeon]|nr:hypothetical protein [archaeon]
KISSVVLGILLIASIAFSGTGLKLSGPSGAVVADNALEFINTNLLQGQAVAELGDVTEEEGLVKAAVSVMGQEMDIFMTKNGRYLFLQAIDLTEPIEVPEQQTQSEPVSTYSEEDLVKITEFSNCLGEKGLKVYAAGWCGHCKSLVSTFGGKGTMEQIYIECQDDQRNPTEDTELCQEEEITGFPTIKINGEPYQNARTFDAFAEATGCPAPELGSV